MGSIGPVNPTSIATDGLGRPLRDLRISVIDRCNFRCGYCMPKDERAAESKTTLASRLDVDALATIAHGFALAGVRKIRLTGGEPLLRRDLPDLVRRLRAIDGIEELALTTNGSLLARQARHLKSCGLSRITVSLDAVEEERFHAITGKDELGAVLTGIEEARSAGFSSIKVNCVVQRGKNEDQILPLVRLFRGTGVTVRFIEFMDVGTCNKWARSDVLPSSEVREVVHSAHPIHPLPASLPGEVAERYSFDDGSGEIGFISSISRPFCGDCNRARLSASGDLYTCLFAHHGTSLREVVGQGALAVERSVRSLWARRTDRYSELRSPNRPERPGKRIEMYMIGG